MLEKIYKQAAFLMRQNKYPDDLLVEAAAVAERALNFMHTGNAAVITTTVMNPLWIGKALVQDRLPCINQKHINVTHPQRLIIHGENWPYDEIKHMPKTALRRAFILTYGEAHFNVSTVSI